MSLWVKKQTFAVQTACPLYPRKGTSAERFNDRKPYRFLRAGTMPRSPFCLPSGAPPRAPWIAHTISDKSKIAPRLCVSRGREEFTHKRAAPPSGRCHSIWGCLVRPSPRSWQRTGARATPTKWQVGRIRAHAYPAPSSPSWRPKRCAGESRARSAMPEHRAAAVWCSVSEEQIDFAGGRTTRPAQLSAIAVGSTAVVRLWAAPSSAKMKLLPSSLASLVCSAGRGTEKNTFTLTRTPGHRAPVVVVRPPGLWCWLGLDLYGLCRGRDGGTLTILLG